MGERALQFRARQNVILELGFFYGYLGWEHVFVLYKPPDEIFPNFERPSDLGGVVFDEVEAGRTWKIGPGGKAAPGGILNILTDDCMHQAYPRGKALSTRFSVVP